MAADGQGGRRLPCPCCVQRAERHLTAAHRRLLGALAVSGLAALAVLGISGVPARAQPAARPVSLPPGHGGGPPAADWMVLTAIAVVAAGAFTVLLAIARSQRRPRSAFADWRTWPPGYDPWADGRDPVADGHEGSACRPGYGSFKVVVSGVANLRKGAS